jgi:hypothetical protein
LIAEISIKVNEKPLQEEEDGVDEESTIPTITTNLESLRRDFDKLHSDLENIDLK